MYKKWVVLFVGIMLLVACGRGTDTSQPPEIALGQDVCTRCGMIINEEKFAAAYWTSTGEARLFDDTGGMFLYTQEEPEQVDSYWVHDYQESGWLDAETAWYVHDQPFQTPMGFGLLAFQSEEAARLFAADREGAEVMDFDAIMSGLADGSLGLNPMHGHMH